VVGGNRVVDAEWIRQLGKGVGPMQFLVTGEWVEAGALLP
jgi:hypothetical protein